MVVGDLQIWDQDRSRIESPGGRFSIGILVFGDVMSGSQCFFVFPDDLSRWMVMRWSVPSILLVGILRDSHEPWKKNLGRLGYIRDYSTQLYRDYIKLL